MPEFDRPLPADVIDALRRGNKIEAIKLLRLKTGLGLKEAKDAIDASGVVPAAGTTRLAPGEVPRSSGRLWFVVAVAAVAIVVYYLVRGAL